MEHKSCEVFRMGHFQFIFYIIKKKKKKKMNPNVSGVKFLLYLMIHVSWCQTQISCLFSYKLRVKALPYLTNKLALHKN